LFFWSIENILADQLDLTKLSSTTKTVECVFRNKRGVKQPSIHSTILKTADKL